MHVVAGLGKVAPREFVRVDEREHFRVNRRAQRLDSVPNERVSADLVRVKVADRQGQALRCEGLGGASGLDDVAVVEHGVDRVRGVFRAKEREAPKQAPVQMARMQIDTLVGMGISNIIALFIMLTTAATLNAHGVTDIQTSSQAAEALRPIAGRFAFTIFALGIIGTGLLAVPVLAGSAAYAVGEALKWRVGLAQRPGRARAFYGAIALATLVGAILNFTPLDPIKALFWSAVINGVAAVPIMVMIMLMASRKQVMGQFALRPLLKALGWLATVVMAVAAIGMFATLTH